MEGIMTKFFYGVSENHHDNEAKEAITTALSLLIDEMREFMERSESISASFETDEHQANMVKFDSKFVTKLNEYLPSTPPTPPIVRDTETEKHRVRDENTAELGGQQKRLERLQKLHSVFVQKEPSDVATLYVQEVYNIFKLQVLRYACYLSDELIATGDEHVARLTVYSRAFTACGCLDESFEEHDIFPFSE
jgi:hypothetical protein